MKKSYDDDDGRTIADMSGVDRQSVFSGLFAGLRFSRPARERRAGPEHPEENAEGSGPQPVLEKEERRGYILGAMSAGLLIGLIILAVFALAIVVILWIGGVL